MIDTETADNVIPLDTQVEAKKAPKKKAPKKKAKAEKKAEKKPKAEKVAKPAAKRVAGMKAQGQVPKAAFDAMLKHCNTQGLKAADYVRDAVIAQLKHDKLWT